MTWRARKITREFIVTVCEISMAFMSAYLAMKVDTVLALMFGVFAGVFTVLSVAELVLLVKDLNENW